MTQNEITKANSSLESKADFRFFLQTEFHRRRQKNSRYSMRAFAKALEIDHSTLSQILRAKRRVSKAQLQKMAEKIGLSQGQIDVYLSHFSDHFFQISLDAHQIVAHWYHYAIFELMTLKNFKTDTAWIAKKLDISVPEAKKAVIRLKRVGFIYEKEDGSWVQETPFMTTTGNKFTAEAFRRFQKEVLKLSLRSLENTPLDLRDHSGMTFAINSKKIPEAKKRIQKFRRELCNFLQKDNDRDAVYQLSVAFFPLSKLGKD